MESLAYLHYALVYEASGNADPLSFANLRNFFDRLKWYKFSSTFGFWFLWLATTLVVLSVFNNTLAQTFERFGFGEQSQRVRELQQRLNERGYITPNNITGYFGPITRDALRQFKRDRNIPLTTDDVDRQTAEALGLIRAVSTQYTEMTTIGATVQRGNIGSAVTELQTRLRNLGYYFGSIDGIFGVSTQTAVTQFQENNGLFPDGIAGPATWNVLLTGRALASPGAVPLPSASLPQVTTVPIRPPSRLFSPLAVPSSTVGNISTLSRGDRGVEVFDLQSRLRQLGFYQGQLDRIFGPQTETAVFQYQLSRGLFADGIARPETIARIRQETSEQQITRAAGFFPGFTRGTYVVVVPDRGNNTLVQVQGLKSDAFLARNKRGRYIHAGNYANRASAESQSYLLRERGLDARVVYFKR